MTSTPTFGRVLTAMVTPMHPDGSIDLDGVQKVARHLVEHGHDGIVVNGTTGESATVDDPEKIEALRAVVDAVGDQAMIVAGAGTNDTRHSVRLAQQSMEAGADALLVVTPYYNMPTPAGIVEHTRTVAATTDAPVLLYDIPHRTGRALTLEILTELAKVDNIVGVKDAKCDLWFATTAMAETGLEWYSGADEFNLPLLAIGALGVVSVVGHVAGDGYRAMVDAVLAGDLAKAQEIHRRLIPVVNALMSTSQGGIMAKAALVELGVIDSATVRLPYVASTEDHLAKLRSGLQASGITR